MVKLLMFLTLPHGQVIEVFLIILLSHGQVVDVSYIATWSGY